MKRPEIVFRALLVKLMGNQPGFANKVLLEHYYPSNYILSLVTFTLQQQS